MTLASPFRSWLDDPFFAEFDRMASRLLGGGSMHAGVELLPMDVARTADEVWMRMDVPGIKADEIEVHVDGTALVITAERRDDWAGQTDGQAREGFSLLRRERPTGRVTRRIELPDGLRLDHVDAALDAGVLTIRIPFAEHTKPRRVPVVTGGQASAEALPQGQPAAAPIADRSVPVSGAGDGRS